MESSFEKNLNRQSRIESKKSREKYGSRLKEKSVEKNY